jgi:hypothetical protein
LTAKLPGVVTVMLPPSSVMPDWPAMSSILLFALMRISSLTLVMVTLWSASSLSSSVCAQQSRAVGRLDLQPALVGVEAGGLARGDGRGVGGRGLQVLLHDLAQALAAELLHAGRGGQQLGRGAVQHHGGLGEGGDGLALAGVSPTAHPWGSWPPAR